MSQQSSIVEKLTSDGPVAPPTPVVPAWTRRLGLLCAAYVAGVHLGLCDETYKEAAYLGASFAAGALVLIIGASIAAAGQRFSSWAPVVAWLVDCVVLIAAFVAFVLSRTAGLPSYHPSDWPVIQLVAMGAEVAYLALTVIALTHLLRRT